jgi:hypothetical protein
MMSRATLRERIGALALPEERRAHLARVAERLARESGTGGR